jgi:GTPase
VRPRRSSPKAPAPELDEMGIEQERAEEPPVEIAGTVAIVGYPNVGKSTLINRLTETRAAVVHETPGVTRDRKELLCEWSGTTFRLIDTGGVDQADTGPFGPQIVQQAKRAIEEADLVLLVVDARAGITPGDEELADILRRSRRDVLVIANKLDDPRRDAEALEFHRLGLGDPIPLSALHGHGTGDLLDEIVRRLAVLGARPESALADSGRAKTPKGGRFAAAVGQEAMRVAILGRPNVGKSSLLNALLGQERVIVSEVPGTTRDTIDTVLERGDRTFVLVDTAGLRRKRHQRQGIEYYSELRALEAAERADVAIVLVDASEGVVEQDLAVADIARKAGCATVVGLSKWDISDVRIEDVRPDLERRLRQRPPILALSAATGRGLERLLETVEDVYDRYAGRIPTAELNRALAELREARQPPARRGRRLNLLYGTQVSSRPPRFRLFVNDRGLVTRDYGYWVENEIRRRFRLEGVPVSIDFVTSE